MTTRDSSFTSLLKPAGLSRRDFMGRSLAFGAAAAAATSLGGKALWAATPKKGGLLKLAMAHGATSDRLDPATLVNGYQWALGYAMRNALTSVVAGGGVAPSLAESWESSPDAVIWVFNLRKGVEFHDGRPLTVDDVIASINHHRSEDSTSFLKPIAAAIETIEADGDSQVKIALKAGNADLPFAMASAGFTVCPAKADGTIDWESGLGTGGYVVKEYEPGVRATLERYPNYWTDELAHVDEVEFLTIHDPAARSNALMTGEVHVIDQVDLKTASMLARRDGIAVEETAGPLHFVFPMRTDTAPFDNKDVRLALKYAIDREELLRKILRGHGTLGNDHPIGPSYRFHAAGLEQRAYDPDKAKHHLKQAGVDGLTVQLSAAESAFPGAVDAAVLYREQAAKAGITVDVVREPNDGYWSNVWMKKPWCASYWGGYTTESEMFTTGYAPGAAWNDTFWQDDRFVKIMAEAQAELDEDKRAEMYAEMQAIVRDDGGALIPLFANDVLARNDKVAHGELAADRGFDGRHIIERWWMVE